MAGRRGPSPFSLDHAQAWALLLPPDPDRGIAGTVEPWEPWATPSPLKAIDESVTRLHGLREERGARLYLRSRKELEAIDIACPYRHAREHIVQAVADVVEWSQAMAAVGLDRAQDLECEADRLRDAATDLMAVLPLAERAALRFQPARPASRRSGGQERERTARLNRVVADAEGVIAYLREVAGDVAALRQHLRPKNGPGKLWEQVIAERLGYCWRDLTGRNPSPTGDEFIEFLDAAFVSLGGEPRTLKWRTPVRTAVERVLGITSEGGVERVGGRPAWDRFDRLETRAQPPGGAMNVRPVAELAARHERRQRCFVGHVLDWVDAPSPEARRAAHLVLLTEWSYAPDDEKNREEVRRIVTNRDTGGNDIWAGTLRPTYGTQSR